MHPTRIAFGCLAFFEYINKLFENHGAIFKTIGDPAGSRAGQFDVDRTASVSWSIVIVVCAEKSGGRIATESIRIRMPDRFSICSIPLFGLASFSNQFRV